MDNLRNLNSGPSSPSTDDVSTISSSRLINSIFKKLPGDNEKFHQLADELKKDENLKFSPFNNIKLIDCFSDRITPFYGRAYLASDDKIYLCGNAIWKAFVQNDRPKVQALLLHELVHFYDKKVRHFNFYNASDLACSEIRAYHMSNECRGSDAACIFRRTQASLKVSDATKYLETTEQTHVISGVLENCMKDQNPFQKDFSYETAREKRLRQWREMEQKKRGGGGDPKK